MKHSELRHQPRHVNPRIQGTWSTHTAPAIISTFLYLHNVLSISHLPIQYFLPVFRNENDMVLAFPSGM